MSLADRVKAAKATDVTVEVDLGRPGVLLAQGLDNGRVYEVVDVLDADTRTFLRDASVLEELTGLYANRGVNLVRLGDCWAFRTAADLAPAMKIEPSSA